MNAYGQSTVSPPAPASIVDGVQNSELTKARLENERAQARYYEAHARPESHSLLADVPWSPILAILGTLAGYLLNDWLTRRKIFGESQRTYARHRYQVRLAASELHDAFATVLVGEPLFLDKELIFTTPDRPDNFDSKHDFYRKHDLVTLIYRFCAFLGWLELYRTDPSFLRASAREDQRNMENLFAGVRKALADARHSSGSDHTDDVLLGSDQRAAGEQMIDTQSPGIIGYAPFCERLFRDPSRKDPTNWSDPKSQNWWVWNVTLFLMQLRKPEKNLARQRVEDVRSCLAKLKALLEDDPHTSATPLSPLRARVDAG